MLFFTIKHCQNLTLTKGHGAGITMGKCMRMELVFFFFFCDLFLHFFVLSLSLSLSLHFLLPFFAHFVCSASWATIDWYWRGCITKVQRQTEHFWSENLTIFFLLWKSFAPFLYKLPEDRSKSVGQQLRINTLPPSEWYVNPRKCVKSCFTAIYSVCLGTLITKWENLGPANKLIIFYISLERPRVLKNAAKMWVGLDIYLWNPT